jgi:hypothetical protein
MTTKVTESCKKVAQKFVCQQCDYITCRKSSYDKHILTAKHLKVTQVTSTTTSGDIKVAQKQNCCDFCHKKYNSRNGLWKHKKICEIKNSHSQIYDDTNLDDETIISEVSSLDFTCEDLTDKKLIFFLLKENKEFKNMMMEQQNMMMEVIKNGTHNTTNNTDNSHSHNKTFNLNFFLNEQCKDAVNMSDFIDSIKVELCDVENTGRTNFVEGISNLLLKNLRALDKFKRPIHCSDLKRETLYIKDNNKWEKDDDEKMKFKNVIKVVANENIKKIADWTKEHPECRDPESRKNDLYLHIVSNAMSGGTAEETQKNLNSIIRNIAKEITIDKAK